MISNPRVIAAKFCRAVIIERKSLGILFNDLIDYKDVNIPLIKELVYGSLRFFPKLKAIVNYFLTKKTNDNSLSYFLLIVGCYQLLYTKIPSYAVINETVDSLDEQNQSAQKGFVNAILRKIDQNKPNIDDFITKEFEILSHPKFIHKIIKKDYPKDYKDILFHNNQKAPMWIRINTAKTNINDYLEELSKKNISVCKRIGNFGICLESPCDVNELPGFSDGLCTVQDASAQMATIYLDPKPKERILDACAAPGGKTSHILELCNGDVDLTALDSNPLRLEKLKDNLSRFDWNFKIVTGHAEQIDEWWDKKLFDRILLDVPCSGLGVIRRHPDIKYLRDEQSIEKIVTLQSRIIESIWKTLKIGGTLLYTTCSILKRENSIQINDFCYRHKNELILEKLDDFSGQRLPGENDQDGFFYAKIRKIGF